MSSDKLFLPRGPKLRFSFFFFYFVFSVLFHLMSAEIHGRISWLLDTALVRRSPSLPC